MKLTQSHEKKRELFLFQLLVCAEKLLSGPGSQLRQSLQIAESSQWQTEKKKKLFNRYSFPTAFSKFSPKFFKPLLEPRQLFVLPGGVRDETEQLQQDRTFYSARARDESMWGGGAGVEV